MKCRKHILTHCNIKKSNGKVLRYSFFPEIRKGVASYAASHAMPLCLSRNSYLKIMMGVEN
jgi:hypothetical protein